MKYTNCTTNVINFFPKYSGQEEKTPLRRQPSAPGVLRSLPTTCALAMERRQALPAHRHLQHPCHLHTHGTTKPMWVPRPRSPFPRDPPPRCFLERFPRLKTSQRLRKKWTKQKAEVCGFIPEKPSAVHRDRIPLPFRVPLWLLPTQAP